MGRRDPQDESLLLQILIDQADRFENQVLEIELLDIRFDLPGLDPGDVDHLVDEARRSLPDLRMTARFSFCTALTDPSHSSWRILEKPMIELSGVRCSWLIDNSRR
jgi:hypothetical protein